MCFKIVENVLDTLRNLINTLQYKYKGVPSNGEKQLLVYTEAQIL